MIKVTTIQGKTYEGEFYALDPVTKSVTLKGPGDGYLVINSHHITSLTGSFGKPADVSKFGASVTNIEQQELAALRAAERSLEGINFHVHGEIQALFDRISLVFNHCEWSAGNSIQILEEYVIDAPYDTVRVMAGKDGSGLERIQMMLQGERRKLNL